MEYFGYNKDEWVRGCSYVDLKYDYIPYSFTVTGMCLQWSAVVVTDHHLDKIDTATNLLTSTTISA